MSWNAVFHLASELTGTAMFLGPKKLAKPCHGQLSRDDCNDCDCRKGISEQVTDHRDQQSRDDQLVRDRIEHAPEIALLVPAPREEAIKPIGRCRHDKQRERRRPQLQVDHDNEWNDGRDTAQR